MKPSYKSPKGMKSGIALTQWLYSGEQEHDSGKEMAPYDHLDASPERFPRFTHRLRDSYDHSC
jgi:hypothetical protein